MLSLGVTYWHLLFRRSLCVLLYHRIGLARVQIPRFLSAAAFMQRVWTTSTNVHSPGWDNMYLSISIFRFCQNQRWRNGVVVLWERSRSWWAISSVSADPPPIRVCGHRAWPMWVSQTGATALHACPNVPLHATARHLWAGYRWSCHVQQHLQMLLNYTSKICIESKKKNS